MNSPPGEGCLIIGYGNRLRGDDAVGVHAARILARRGFRTIAVHQLTPELAAAVARARSVVFVDADVQLAPGEVAISRMKAGGQSGLMVHHLQAQSLLDLARDLYAAAPEAWRVAIGAQDFGLGRRLSKDARKGLRGAVAEIISGLNVNFSQSH